MNLLAIVFGALTVSGIGLLWLYFLRTLRAQQRQHDAEMQGVSQRRATAALEAEALLAEVKASLEAEREQLIERMTAEAKETFARGVLHLTEQMGAMQVELERAREVAQDERSKRERYFTKIADFEKIAHNWQKSYYDQSIGHGNAQQIMMDCIETLARQLQGAGIPPKIPSVIHAVRAEFMEQHQLPAVAGLAELQAAQSKTLAAAAPAEPPTQ